MVFSRARISRSIVADIAASASRIDAHAVALHRGQHGRERQVDRLVEFREALRFDFLAQQRREALQVIGVFAGSAGERDVLLPQHHVGEAVFRRGGTQQIRIQHRRVANSRHRARRAIRRALGSCTIFGRAGSRRNSPSAASISPLSSSHAVRDNAGLGRNFDRGDARAEAFGFAFALRERQPHGDFGCRAECAFRYFLSAAGDSSAAESLGGGCRGRGRRGQIAQQRSETQFRVERAQGFDVRLAPREVVEHQLHRRVRVDDRELLRHQHRFAAVFQRLAVALAFDFRRRVPAPLPPSRIAGSVRARLFRRCLSRRECCRSNRPSGPSRRQLFPAARP